MTDRERIDSQRQAIVRMAAAVRQLWQSLHETHEGRIGDCPREVCMRARFAMVHAYSDPRECPRCGASLCDFTAPPYKREHGRVENDRVVEYQCPDCNHRWPA